jgi:hypothetical protein
MSDELESRLTRAMHAEADRTATSPDALVRIRARVAPAPKSSPFAAWLRPAAVASAMAFTLIGGTMIGLQLAGGGGTDDNVAEPPSVLFNPAASSGPSPVGVNPDGTKKQPGVVPVPSGILPSPAATPLVSADPLASALVGPEKTHKLPVDNGGSYVAITGPDSGVTVGRTFELTGMARTFEANVVIEVSQNGSVVKRDYTTAAVGQELSSWTKTLTLEPGAYRIDAFEESMKGDGTRNAVDTIWILVAGESAGAAKPGDGTSAQPPATTTTPPPATPDPAAEPTADDGTAASDTTGPPAGAPTGTGTGTDTDTSATGAESAQEPAPAG